MKITEIIEKVRNAIVDMDLGEENQINDEMVWSIIEDLVLSHFDVEATSYREITSIIDRVFYSIRSEVSILEPFLNDDSIVEIMVNGPDNIFVEKGGKLIKTDLRFESIEDMETLMRRLASRVHREINELNPIVDARLNNGARVNCVYKNIALNGPIITIRKFPKMAITMDDLISYNTITSEAAEFLKKLVKCRYNIFISGGTSSGKTTFLNALSNFIDGDERIIIIEDSAELNITSVDNIVRLECKNQTASGGKPITMKDLIKTSLRMRPSRIVVGEVRGGEILDMLAAMNTGHDGSLSTGHGNSVRGMLRRLESMYLQAADFPIDAIRSQIAEGIDIIVHLGRLPDMSRKVLEISEIEGVIPGGFKLNPIFTYTSKSGLIPTGRELIDVQKMVLNGGE